MLSSLAWVRSDFVQPCVCSTDLTAPPRPGMTFSLNGEEWAVHHDPATAVSRYMICGRSSCHTARRSAQGAACSQAVTHRRGGLHTLQLAAKRAERFMKTSIQQELIAPAAFCSCRKCTTTIRRRGTRRGRIHGQQSSGS